MLQPCIDRLVQTLVWIPGSRSVCDDSSHRPSRSHRPGPGIGRTLWGILLSVAAATIAAEPVRLAPDPSAATLATPMTPRVAIVLDDLGYRRNAGFLAGLSDRLTYAILPNAPHATALSHQLNAMGREIIIHLPMEPVGHHDLSLIHI